MHATHQLIRKPLARQKQPLRAGQTGDDSRSDLGTAGMGEFSHAGSVQQKPLRAHAPDGPPQGEPKPPARPPVTYDSRDMKLPLGSGQRDSRKEVENQPQGGVLGSPEYHSDTIPSTSASMLDPANTGDVHPVGGVHAGPRSAPPSGLNVPHQRHYPSSERVHSEHIASPGYPAIQASEMHPEQNQDVLVVGDPKPLSKFKHDGSSANSGSGKSQGQLSGGYSAPNTFHSDPTVLSQHMSSNHDPSHVCLLYTSPSPRDATLSRMPSSA